MKIILTSSYRDVELLDWSSLGAARMLSSVSCCSAWFSIVDPVHPTVILVRFFLRSDHLHHPSTIPGPGAPQANKKNSVRPVQANLRTRMIDDFRMIILRFE